MVTGGIDLIRNHTVRHYVKMGKKFYYAQTIDFYRKKHPDLFAKQATIFRPAYFRHWRRLAKDPIHSIGFLFMKTCEFGAGGLSLMVSKIKRKAE